VQRATGTVAIPGAARRAVEKSKFRAAIEQNQSVGTQILYIAGRPSNEFFEIARLTPNMSDGFPVRLLTAGVAA
jgi:hypothetical protein